MRCKNCGFENEDGRYICQNCGSPLYDENDEVADGEYDYGNDYPEDDDSNDSDDAKKKQTVTIIIAVIIIIAIAAGVIFGSAAGKKNKETTTESTTISTTEEEKTTKKTTTTTTEKETTTKETTTEESTTKETTTESTTAEKTFHVYADIDGNGTVTGDGEYKKGDKAVLNASADAGYEFEGWYDSNGSLVASGTKYTVTVKNDITLTARFKAVDGGAQ